MRRLAMAGGIVLFLALVATAARADIFSYEDSDGVLHLTNVEPRGKSAGRYKVILHEAPRRAPRKGVVPVMPGDSDPARFHRYDRFIDEASRLYAIPHALIRAVVMVESNYDPRVVSNCGAQGLMQLMPATGRRMGVRDPFDPRQNILGGTRYLRYLANMFGGDIVLTIAGYHAGENAVLRYRGVPPYETTQRYVPAVLRHYYRFRTEDASRRSASTEGAESPRGGEARR